MRIGGVVVYVPIVSAILENISIYKLFDVWLADLSVMPKLNAIATYSWRLNWAGIISTTSCCL